MEEDTYVAGNQSQGAPSILGANEGSSPWSFNGILGTLGGLASTGAKVYQSFSSEPGPAEVPQQSTARTPAATAARTSTGISGYLPWIIGGVVALVVLVLVMRR